MTKVLEVYRGDEVAVGDELTIFSVSWWPFFQDERLILNRGFTNFMQEGDEYLIFLNGPADNLQGYTHIFELVPTIISPMFNYETHEHAIPTHHFNPEDGMIIPFSEVSRDEFSLTSEEELEALVGLKKYFFELFPQ